MTNELDEGIRHHVKVLNENGIATYSSCEGTGGLHAFNIPRVEFGMSDEPISAFEMGLGTRAWRIAKENGLKPWRLSLSIFPDEDIHHWTLEFESTPSAIELGEGDSIRIPIVGG